MRIKRRMIAVEFEAVRPLLNISAERIESARLALVEGRTFQAVGDQFGWSRQAVSDAVNVVWKTFENYRKAQQAIVSATAQLPAGWEQATLIAPSHLMAKFRWEIAQVSPRQNTKQSCATHKKKALRRKTEGPKVNVNETKEGSA